MSSRKDANPRSYLSLEYLRKDERFDPSTCHSCQPSSFSFDDPVFTDSLAASFFGVVLCLVARKCLIISLQYLSSPLQWPLRRAFEHSSIIEMDQKGLSSSEETFLAVWPSWRRPRSRMAKKKVNVSLFPLFRHNAVLYHLFPFPVANTWVHKSRMTTRTFFISGTQWA